ncbi:BTB/POZ fold protein [Ascosphaera apis ARSEF 7405]|uniref:BTB/POZ fold protein n=1 Tax=Ascosphaera apis ARSEF 7405 TaxID=392613 RepID=A0A168CAA4_9EURO|nr:BTB/POZ fold protein [Ascosphaera apis ARSEF 7405]
MEQLVGKFRGYRSRKPMIPPLLLDSTYSDFTIKCRRHQFPVHKFLFYSRSPVIRKALTGEFRVGHTSILIADIPVQSIDLIQEAQENVFALDHFKSDVVAAMICWVYTGEYSIPYAEDDEGCFEDEYYQIETRQHAYFHAQMAVLADFLDMPDLIEDACWELFHKLNDSFADIIHCLGPYVRYCFENGPKALRERLVDIVHENLELLVEREEFKAVDVPEFHTLLINHIYYSDIASKQSLTRTTIP